MAQFNIILSGEHLKDLFLSNGKDEAFFRVLEEIFNQVLLAQSTEQPGLSPMKGRLIGLLTAMESASGN